MSRCHTVPTLFAILGCAGVVHAAQITFEFSGTVSTVGAAIGDFGEFSGVSEGVTSFTGSVTYESSAVAIDSIGPIFGFDSLVAFSFAVDGTTYDLDPADNLDLFGGSGAFDTATAVDAGPNDVMQFGLDSTDFSNNLAAVLSFNILPGVLADAALPSDLEASDVDFGPDSNNVFFLRAESGELIWEATIDEFDFGPQVIPLPPSAWMAAAGLACAGTVRRRRATRG